MSYLNSEQEEFMKDWIKIPWEKKCWCGWELFGECYDCSKNPKFKDLTLADRKTEEGNRLINSK